MVLMLLLLLLLLWYWYINVIVIVIVRWYNYYDARIISCNIRTTPMCRGYKQAWDRDENVQTQQHTWHWQSIEYFKVKRILSDRVYKNTGWTSLPPIFTPTPPPVHHTITPPQPPSTKIIHMSYLTLVQYCLTSDPGAVSCVTSRFDLEWSMLWWYVCIEAV